uniref:Uncharacterized protein n=1 Tax=Oryza barthii TaxID=65489 RepID=A0A0D3GPV4_9ORYZ
MADSPLRARHLTGPPSLLLACSNVPERRGLGRREWDLGFVPRQSTEGWSRAMDSPPRGCHLAGPPSPPPSPFPLSRLLIVREKEDREESGQEEGEARAITAPYNLEIFARYVQIQDFYAYVL